MKKIFTFFAASHCAVCMSAETRATLWEGSLTFDDKWPSVQIQSSSFADAKAGDKIELIYTTYEAAEYWQFKTHLAGTETLLAGNKADLNEWGCADVAKATTSYKITLTKDDVAGLKEKDLYVFGYSLNVTKVNLIQPVSTDVSHAVATEQTADNAEYNVFGIKHGVGVYVKNGKKYIKSYAH